MGLDGGTVGALKRWALARRLEFFVYMSPGCTIGIPTLTHGVGLPTICQRELSSNQYGGFAPATPGFNAFGQTGWPAGRL